MDGHKDSQVDQVVETVREIYESRDTDRFASALEGLRAPDSAEVLTALPREIRVQLFRSMDQEMAGEVLTLVDEGVARDILESLTADEIVPLIDFMASDDATDIINLLEPGVAGAVLRRISREDYEDVSELLKFDEESAGGLMARELVTVRAGRTIADVIAVLREEHDSVEHLQYIYVVDSQEVLLGTIPVINLLITDPARRVEEVMDRDVITVGAETDQEDVAAMFAKYDLFSMPVVDDSGRLAGRITVDDIIDVIEEEATEDITMMAGTGDEEFYEKSPVKLSRARLPWLLTGLCGGIASAFIMNSFKTSLESVLTLAFFVPVIMAMGGNVGIQSSAIVVRELALGGLSVSQTGGKLLRELKVSIINGLVIGTVLLLAVSIWQGDFRLGALLGICMFIIIFWATIMGAFIPLMLKKAKIDPALATGPFITTFNDIVGIAIYLGIASLFLEWLGKV
jgi:magnesium transporter